MLNSEDEVEAAKKGAPNVVFDEETEETRIINDH
jgi:hypothetical protein